jgi:DNA-binding transcriptional LysR family regulator
VGQYLRDNYLSPLIPRIHRELPHVEIEFRTMVLAAEAMRLFERRELDLAICATSDDGISPIKGSRIFELPLILVAQPGTNARLAAGQASLQDFEYIFPIRRDMGGERWAKDRLQGMGITPSVPPLFVELTREAARMVEDGQGIGCFMSHSVNEGLNAGRLEVLDIPLAPMRRIIACSPHVSEEARTVQQMLLKVLSA